MTRIRIHDDHWAKSIAGRPIAGHTATIINKPFSGSDIVAVQVDGLAPYGHDGKTLIAPGYYTPIKKAKQ